jgi:hypothetical protein
VVVQPEQSIQANALRLLKAIEQATQGSARPAVLDELRDLQMTEDQARAAFHYLKSKGWIEAGFGISYSARVKAAGHDAIKEAEVTPDKKASSEQRREVLTLKPGIWGMSLDVKEAWRRIRAWYVRR